MLKKNQRYKVYGWGDSIWNKVGFHKTIHLKSLKQYNDFYEREWLLKLLWDIRLFGPSWSSPIRLSLKLTKPEDFNQLEIERTHDRNLDSICKKVKANLGRQVVRTFYWDDNIYVLEGLELTHEEYYYILKDGHNLTYETCCAGIEFI